MSQMILIVAAVAIAVIALIIYGICAIYQKVNGGKSKGLNNPDFSFNNPTPKQKFSSNQANEQFSGKINNNLNTTNQINNNQPINDFNKVNNLNNTVQPSNTNNVAPSEPVANQIPKVEPPVPNNNGAPSGSVVSPITNVEPTTQNNVNNINNQ